MNLRRVSWPAIEWLVGEFSSFGASAQDHMGVESLTEDELHVAIQRRSEVVLEHILAGRSAEAAGTRQFLFLLVEEMLKREVVPASLKVR